MRHAQVQNYYIISGASKTDARRQESASPLRIGGVSSVDELAVADTLLQALE